MSNNDSIVGRFLEHACIFYFENASDPKWYIGSADLMTRNLDHRVEAVTPVEAPQLRKQLRFILETSLVDNRRRWVMQSDGSYEQVTPDDEPVRDIQEILISATATALEHGYGAGMVVDTDIPEENLLIGPATDGGVRDDLDWSATIDDSDGGEQKRLNGGNK